MYMGMLAVLFVLTEKQYVSLTNIQKKHRLKRVNLTLLDLLQVSVCLN